MMIDAEVTMDESMKRFWQTQIWVVVPLRLSAVWLEIQTADVLWLISSLPLAETQGTSVLITHII